MDHHKNEIPIGTGRADWRGICYAAAPALLYTALSSAAYSLLASALPQMPGIMLQGAALAICLVYFWWKAKKEQVVASSHAGKSSRLAYRYPACFCYASATVLCSIACNYLIFLTGLTQRSPGYRHVEEVFYGNSLLAELATLCILGPMAEELVYRGFVFQRLRRRRSTVQAAVLSALVFGILHLNLVQGIYAFVLGVLLAYIVSKTGSLVAAAAAHMAANVVSVLWTETGLLRFLNRQGAGMYAAAGLCLVLTGIFLNYGNQLIKRSGHFHPA